jgi:DnaJ-class molecular chaperone
MIRVTEKRTCRECNGSRKVAYMNLTGKLSFINCKSCKGIGSVLDGASL